MLEVQNLDLTNVGNTTNGGLNDMITGFGVEVNAAEALQYSPICPSTTLRIFENPFQA